jgi:hypothetical protein
MQAAQGMPDKSGSLIPDSQRRKLSMRPEPFHKLRERSRVQRHLPFWATWPRLGVDLFSRNLCLGSMSTEIAANALAVNASREQGAGRGYKDCAREH